MKIDQINIDIMRHIRDGKKSIKKIANKMSISENTVRARLNRMVKEGTIEICGLVDPTSIPGHMVVLVGVKLSTMELVKRGEDFKELRGVVSASVVTGRYDLILTVLLNEDFGLLEFYTEEVSRVKDVQSVETFVIYKSYNLKVPYIL
ncbi:MAG: Lrp/AsnC family transcriptional regulator [Deltaproteobacteria bacterium]|nr:Lrp/AsnC family transcriptional regulator [Deltaproteobacteria bacterium]